MSGPSTVEVDRIARGLLMLLMPFFEGFSNSIIKNSNPDLLE